MARYRSVTWLDRGKETMSFPATVHQILIASPSDVAMERLICRECIYHWNSLNSRKSSLVFLPVQWETHSVPEMGDRPQAVLNKQLVDMCDALIGIFWTRIGSSIGVAESGTVEEIERLMNANRHVMLYFSSKPAVPTDLDLAQLHRLRAFRTQCSSNGIVATFESDDDLRVQLLGHLDRLSERFTGQVVETKERIPPGGLPFQLLQRGPGGTLVWDWVRAHA